MAIDKEKYISKYVDEGLENITLIESLIFDIRDGISVDETLASVLRALHTIKGLSRMLEFKRIEELTHAMESVFVAFKEQRISLTENAIKLNLITLDQIKAGLGLIQDSKNDSIETHEYLKSLNALIANEEFSLPESKDKTAGITVSTENPVNIMDKSDEFITKDVSQKDNAPKSILGTAPEKKPQVRSESIRLSIEKIDNIIKSIASLQFLEIAAKAISVDFVKLNGLIKEHNTELKAGNQSTSALSANFRKLEKLSDRINSMLKNYYTDTSKQIRSAYDTVITMRTLPMSTILDGYPRYVFQLSGELGKKVHLTIEGKDNEIDKNIIETLSDVLMHMVRNAIDHGIETPEERIAAGKSETGKISIVCSRESGGMKIIISDDGKGLNIEKIRQKAVREGIVSETAAASLSKEEFSSLIFRSGFSTSGNVSNVSGRGVGMDVVRESIETMKGSIIIDSIQNEGTTFIITVPLSIAALVGFPIEANGMKFIIPAAFVETILMLNHEDIITVIDRPEFKYNNRMIKLFYLNQVLNIDKGSVINPADVIFVIIVRAYDDIVALAVNNIDSMRSVILKTMPAFLEKMPVFTGIVLNEDYEMLSVLHIPTVIKMAKQIKTIDIKKRNIDLEKLKKTILVVDDSRPTREIERDILLSEGYLVDTAADGAEALNAAKAKKYDLICTDINMPVMDGFKLTENLKKNEELSHIPIIVISSLSSEENQKRAALLGASRYIVKNSFNNHNLLAAVRELIGETNE